MFLEEVKSVYMVIKKYGVYNFGRDVGRRYRTEREGLIIMTLFFEVEEVFRFEGKDLFYNFIKINILVYILLNKVFN